MKPSYAPDNTLTSIVVILLLAVGVSVVALLLGPSEKPDVRAIGLAITPAEAAAVTGNANPDANGAANIGSVVGDDGAGAVAGDIAGTDGTSGTDATAGASEADATTTTVEFDESGERILDEQAGTQAGTTGQTDGGATATAIAIPIPTSTPAPTPGIVAAVEPTLVPDETSAASALDAELGVPAGVTAGTVSGAFFTSPDEDEGAVVDRNEISLTLAEDGTGDFAGVLEITLVDSTRISLAMSGPLRWSSESPQVVAELNGSFVRDSPIDSDDIESTDAELRITSLGSGSGSVCAPTCFGFTFAPQTGL